MHRGITPGRQVRDRRLDRARELGRERRGPDEHGIIGRSDRVERLHVAAAFAEPVYPHGIVTLPQGIDGRWVELAAFADDHDLGRVLGDGASEAILDADPAPAGEPAPVAEKVEGHDRAAETFQGAVAETRMGM
jgi:hypothetical protein